MQRIVPFAALVALSSLTFGCGGSSQAPEDPGTETGALEINAETTTKEGEQIRQTVEAGCGKCMFKMTGVDSHELAIRIDGKPYLVMGEYVDPTEAGMCEAVKKAQVVGRVVQFEGLTVNDQQAQFHAESIDLQE